MDFFENKIENELLNIISKEIVNIFDEKSSEILIDKASSIIKDAGKKDETIKYAINCFNDDENLYKLKETLGLLSFLNKGIVNLQLINNRRLENPDNKLYVFIWLYLNIELFREDEYFEYELIDFLTEVFTKYDWLLHLDNFFDGTGILYIIDNVWLTDKVVNLFEKASERNPDILRLKIVLSYLFNMRKEFVKAHDMVNLLFNSLKETDDDYKITKLFYLRLRSEIYFESGDIDKALIDTNYIIDQDGNNKPYDYYMTFLLRMMINLKKNNVEQLDSDSFKLINSLGLSEIFMFLHDYYPEANNYIEQYINRMVKIHTTKYDKKTNDKTFKIHSEIGKIEITGNDNWKWQDKIDPWFGIAINNRNSISIKFPKLGNENLIQKIEVLYNAKLTEDEQQLIIDWLNSPSLISEKNIGVKKTNIHYMALVWDFLNAENSVDDALL